MSSDIRKVCFVVMGFGRKTDFETGRTLDLDATYEAIIKPAAEDRGLRCIRADEIMHSGVIDLPMYEMLLRADLVIADISTGNVNAVYELGVRHALRPFSTIIMKEGEGRLYFDLNHVNTFEYRHLGEDIGAREAERARRALITLIQSALNEPKPDSPVYTFLPKLKQPQLTDEEYAELLDEAEAAEERLVGLIRSGEAAMKAGRIADAAADFARAAEIKPGEPYIIQQQALATYKSSQPSELEALISGLRIIETLGPDSSNDPETLGIAGAIRKRLWLLTKDRAQLDIAIRLYGRGFEVKRDYYNGENLALCYEFRAAVQDDPAERQYDLMSASKARAAVVEIASKIKESFVFEERSDRKWVLATLANSLFALGRSDEAEAFEADFLGGDLADWERKTYFAGKEAVLGLRGRS